MESDPVLAALTRLLGDRGEALRVAQGLGHAGLCIVPVEAVLDRLPTPDLTPTPLDELGETA